MLAFEILIDRWELALSLTSAFLVGTVAGLLFLAVNRDKALKLAEKLQRLRKPVIKFLFETLKKPQGAFRAVLLIFAVNLIGGAVLWATVGGSLIVLPFLWLALLGLLVVLVSARYREVLPMTLAVVPFEIGAFIVASTGGVNIGINLFFNGDVSLALREWITLFYTLVIPLQFIGAFFEGTMTHRVYVVQRKPLPEWLLKD